MTLEALTVTGYSREKLAMDEDILDFYENAPLVNLRELNAPMHHEQAEKVAPSIAEPMAILRKGATETENPPSNRWPSNPIQSLFEEVDGDEREDSGVAEPDAQSLRFQRDRR